MNTTLSNFTLLAMLDFVVNFPPASCSVLVLIAASGSLVGPVVDSVQVLWETIFPYLFAGLVSFFFPPHPSLLWSWCYPAFPVAPVICELLRADNLCG